MNDFTYPLDDEERQILADIEAGHYIDVSDFAARKKELQEIAKNTLNKTRNINIRISERDLHRLKAKSVEEGIPYQTLASSILHKSVAQ